MKKETLAILIIGAFVLLLVNFPILYFYLIPKTNLVFLGRRVINSQDTYTYVALIEQAKQGKVFFTNLYTNENQIASLIRPSYFVIGRIAALLNISSILAFHLARIILSIAFLAVLYKFICLFFESAKKKDPCFYSFTDFFRFGFYFKRHCA